MQVGNWDREAVTTQAFVGSEEVPVPWKHLWGTCAFATPHVVIRSIRRCKSAESLHLSPVFHFIVTYLEEMQTPALGTFSGKNYYQVSTEVLQSKCTSHISVEAESRQETNQLNGGHLPKHSRGRNMAQMKSQGLEIINIGLINVHISSMSHQPLQPHSIC